MKSRTPEQEGSQIVLTPIKHSLISSGLDDFISAINPPTVSFIKMIVEGFEPHVFKGAAKTIEKYRPPIFFDVTAQWYAENQSSLSEILTQLENLGYTFYGEQYNELIPNHPQKFGGLVQYNMFAVVEH